MSGRATYPERRGQQSVAARNHRPAPPVRRAAPEPPRFERARRLKFVLATTSAMVLVLTGFAWQQYDAFASQLATAAGLTLGDGEDGALDILLVGTDSRTDAHGNPLSAQELAALRAGDAVTLNTDTLVLVRVPKDGGSATAFSIPRDSYVRVPDGVPGTDWPADRMVKINSAFGSTKFQEEVRLIEKEGVDRETAVAQATLAGRDALVRTVTELTGVTIDHYAEIGLLGFMLLTDAVGGVEVCLNNAVFEPKSGADFPAGRQTLDGSDALSFVRQREGLPGMDAGRIHRQQAFMASLARTVLSTQVLSSPSSLGRITDAVHRSIVLDEDWDIVDFAQQLQSLAGGRVKFQTIPVVRLNGWSSDGKQSVVEVDPAAVREEIARTLTKEEQAQPSGFDGGEYTVNVANTSQIEGLATRVAQTLTSAGFTGGTVGNWLGKPTAISKVLADDPGSEGAQVASALLGGLPVEKDTELPHNTIQVVLTSKYAGPGATTFDPAVPPPGAGEGAPPPPMYAAGDGPQCVD